MQQFLCKGYESDDQFPKLHLSESTVNRLDQRNISVEQDALHSSCWAYDALLCMSGIVCYKRAEGEFAGCLLSGSLDSDLRLRSGQAWQKSLLPTSSSTKHVGLS